MNNVLHQSVHFRDIINIHYDYLEGISQQISAKSDILDEDNLQLIAASMSSKSSLELLAIIDADGNSYYDNGVRKNVASREYFQDAMNGERTLSDPVISKVDGESRIILSVPIFQNKKVVGVLGGSYNVSSLSHMLFSDIYDGAGYTLIVTQDGEIISCDSEDVFEQIDPDENFFDYCTQMQFINTESLKQLQKDFDAQNSGIVQLSRKDDVRYLAYEPLQLDDWYLCYIVPVHTAQNPYQFISHYELILSGALSLGVFLLLLFIFKINSKKQQELLLYSQTDALTGIYNKKSTEDQIDLWFSDGELRGIQAFLMMDIDNFKGINDDYGHAVGDDILMKFGRLLRHEFREDDIIGRIGGDEFCVLMKNIGSESIAISRAESLCKHIREHQFKGIQQGLVTSSMGIAFAPLHGNDYAKLYFCADTALYETKRRGKNGYSIFMDRESGQGPHK